MPQPSLQQVAQSALLKAFGDAVERRFETLASTQTTAHVANYRQAFNELRFAYEAALEAATEIFPAV